jgi:hypothetical protein
VESEKRKARPNPEKDEASRVANAERRKAQAAAYRAANRDKIKARDAARHAAKREKIRAQAAAYRKANAEKLKGCSRFGACRRLDRLSALATRDASSFPPCLHLLRVGLAPGSSTCLRWAAFGSPFRYPVITLLPTLPDDSGSGKQCCAQVSWSRQAVMSLRGRAAPRVPQFSRTSSVQVRAANIRVRSGSAPTQGTAGSLSVNQGRS